MGIQLQPATIRRAQPRVSHLNWRVVSVLPALLLPPLRAEARLPLLLWLSGRPRIIHFQLQPPMTVIKCVILSPAFLVRGFMHRHRADRSPVEQEGCPRLHTSPPINMMLKGD